MIRNTVRRASISVLAVVAVSMLSGCSVIGFGIGAAAARSDVEYRVGTPYRIASGKSIHVTLKDGEIVNGQYEGVISADDSQSRVLLIRQKRAQIRVPFDSVERIEVRRVKGGKWIGLASGAVLDVIFVAWLRWRVESEWGMGWSGPAL